MYMVSTLFFSVIALALGILCAIFTDFSIKIVVIALGAAAVVKGIYDLLKFRKLISDDNVFHRTILVRSLVSLFFGIAAVALPMTFFKTAENIVHVMLFLLGAYFVFCAVSGLIVIRRLKNAELSTKPYSSEIIIYILIAVLLFLLAIVGVKNILRILGIIVAVCGAIGIFYGLKNRPEELTPDAVEDVTDEPSSENLEQPETKSDSETTAE